MTNYAFTTLRDLPTPENGHHFKNTNFCQAQPHTPIFEGVSGLVFERCNLMNCDVPEDAEVIDCLHIHKSLCKHLWSEKVHHLLDDCDENCEHVVDSDSIEIDGVSVDVNRTYEDKVVE